MNYAILAVGVVLMGVGTVTLVNRLAGRGRLDGPVELIVLVIGAILVAISL